MRKGESIFKRKDERYEARYIKGYENGKAIYGYVYAKTYIECKKKYLMISQNELKKTAIKNKKQNENLNVLITRWLESKNNLKESSYTRYYNLIMQHIKKILVQLKLIN